MPETCMKFIREGEWYSVKCRGDHVGNLVNNGKWTFDPSPFPPYGRTASELQEIANKLNELNIGGKES